MLDVFYIFQIGKIVQFLIVRVLGLEACSKKGKFGRLFEWHFYSYVTNINVVCGTVTQLCQDQQLG